MKIVASIQARLGSSRLPGKVLKEICGKPMLHWQVERIRRSRLIDNVVIATSTNPLDDEIEAFCHENSIDCYRGSEDDVLNRIASLIRDLNVNLHVECYGDSPLTDPQLIDEFIGYYLKYQDQVDFVSSTIKTTYPPGLEVVVYPGTVLDKLEQELPSNDPMREHVGYNITRFPDTFRLISMEAPPWFHQPDVYLEVDTAADFQVMQYVIGYFVEKGMEHFTLAQVLDMLRSNPKLTLLNSREERRWKTLRMDSNA